MSTSASVETARLVLKADTAADLMAPNPVSIHFKAPVKEAVALFTQKGFNAAPVIDDAGRPVGVLSSSDILVHDYEKVDYPFAGQPAENASTPIELAETSVRELLLLKTDLATVADLMMPAVYAVSPDASAAKVVADMLGLGVHHLFVVDPDGILVGVISALDVLRRLG